jgi:hypothetical protein
MPHYPAHSDIFRLKLDGKNVQTMPDVKISDFPAQLDQILRPLGITRSSKNYRVLCDCVALICEQEDRLEAVQKEIYTPSQTSGAASGPPFKVPSGVQ